MFIKRENFISVEEIESMAKEIMNLLDKWYLSPEISLFYNGIRMYAKDTGSWIKTKDSPENYCDCVAKKHILTMFYESELFNILLYGEIPYPRELFLKLPDELVENIWKQHPEFLEVVEEEHDYYLSEVEDIQEEMDMMREALDFMEPYSYEKYEDYLDDRECFEEDLYNYGKFKVEAKQELEDFEATDRSLWSRDQLQDTLEGISWIICKEFNEIFDKYGVWHQLGDFWNLTCFWDEYDEYVKPL